MQFLKLLLFSLPATIYAAPAATSTVSVTRVVTTVSTITSTQTTTAQPSTVFVTSTFTSGTTTVTSTVATVTATAAPVTTSVCPGRSASGQALSKRADTTCTTSTSTIASTTTVFTTITVTSTVRPTTTVTSARSTGVVATTTASVTYTTTQTPVVSVTACPTPASCGNQGVQWAYYSNPFGDNNDGPKYSAFDPTYFKTQNPKLTGNTVNVGYQLNGAASTANFYGSSTPESQVYYALDHRGYIYAEYTGTYTFAVSNVDDIFYVWTSATASSGWNKQNTLLTNGISDGSTSATISLTAGTYTALRFMIGNGNGPSGFSLTITDPNGNAILSSSTSTPGYVVQYSCDGTSAPQYPQFGQET